MESINNHYIKTMAQLVADELQEANENLQNMLVRFNLVTTAIQLGLWDVHIEDEDPYHPANAYTWTDEMRRLLGFMDERGFPNLLDAWVSRIHPEDQVRTLNAYIESVKDRTGSTPYNQEHRLKMKNGEYRWFQTVGTAIRDKHGKAIRFAGAIFDIHDKKLEEKKLKEYLTQLQLEISERKRVEEALRTSRETLSLATELARLGPWKVNIEKSLFEFGDEFYAIYGTNVEREGAFMAPDVYIREFVHPDDAWRVEAEIHKELLTTERYFSSRMEHRIIRRDGVVRTIVVQTNFFKDAAGKIVKIYGANQDITEQKEAEAALLVSRETLSMAAELARLGPWKYNVEAKLFEFEDEFYAIYGTNVMREGAFMAPDVYVGEFVHPDDAWMVEEGLHRALVFTERYYSTKMEHRIIRRDGIVRTIVAQVIIERDAEGKIVKWHGTNQDITEQKQAEEAIRKKTEEIQRLAYTDLLTGLPNRVYLTERLQEELEKARRGESSGVLLFIDLDNLKMVNDALGHTYGDALITMAGNRIVEQVGSDAFLGRIGGDEFMAILPGINNREAIGRSVNKMIAALCRDIEILGVRFHISASVGAAIYPDDGETAEEIFKNADNAMYAAKKAGKNCCRFYETTMQVEAYEKMLLTNSLHHAIERGELLLHYQPQLSVNSGTVVGFEALLRWNSPDHGAISPLQFIPLAEQSELIHTIGKWVLREACRFARRLVDLGWGYIHVAVNVSPYQLRSDLFIDSVRDAINDFAILPGQLELEITESALISSLEESTSRLSQLRAMGVRLALDDFGTGYSSLTYLQYLPVKTLKIDKSFIDMIPMPGNRKAIIGHVVNMAHTMEMTVVAEGVETQEQFDYLAQYDCDCIQGYLFSRPIPEEETVRFLSMSIKPELNV